MSERWKQVERLFEAARGKSGEERAALLAEACAGDVELQREVETLLDAYSGAPGFLSRPALDVVARAAADQPTEPAGAGHTAVRPVAEDLVGEELGGKYRIASLIGRGGMGAVFRATHMQLDRTVAIKVMSGGSLGDEESAARFRREALAVARLKHPNIVTVYDFDAAPGAGAYLVMEYLEGRSLGREIAVRGPLGADECADVMRQVLSALDAMHRAGVVHRDLKPENLFLESTLSGRVVKVLDFGIAKLQGGALANDLATKEGMLLGTPLYLSPEAWRGEDTDARSDVYSLGCVLYEMLTGRPPFTADRPETLLYKHLDEEPPAPSRLAGPAAAPFDDVVVRALAKHPASRFQSAAVFARAIPSLPAPVFEEERITLRVEPPSDTQAQAGARVTGGAPNNLPHHVTRFVGRERQVDEVCRLLSEARLVTLVGTGGIGKTRLAIETAWAALDRVPEGVWLVGLAALSEPERLAGTVAGALGLREEPGASMETVLVRRFGSKRALLVLDNCEHLVGACARLADELLRSCPGLRILATSREPLAVDGETIWAVPPLSLPEEDGKGSARALAESEAVRLFLDRAASAQRTFASDGPSLELVGRIVRQVDGIPLAIELAAARVRALSLEQIVEKLSDVFRLLTGGSRTALPRHQTLKATIDWSHDLLSEEERVLFRRLSVFSGGWTLEAAEGVCAGTPGLQVEDVLDALTRLVDRSLVAMVERTPYPRYRMLEVVRQYAAAKLAEAGEREALSEAHGRWFLVYVEATHEELVGAGQAEWLARLETDHANFRAALESVTEPVERLRFTCLLGRFWAFRDHWSEARAQFELALAASGDRAPLPLRARAVYWLAQFMVFQGENGAAAPAFEALELWRSLGDRLGVARSLHQVAGILSVQGRLEEAVAATEECGALARELGDQNLLVSATSKLGQIAQRRGRYEEAAVWFEEGLGVLRALGRTEAVAGMLLNLADTARSRGEFEKALRYLEESRAEQRALPSRQLNLLTNSGLGEVARLQGDLDTAERLLRSSLAEARELGDRWSAATCLASLANVALARGDSGQALELFEEVLEADPERAFGDALSSFFDGFACAEHDPERALRLAGAAEAVRAAVGLAQQPVIAARVEEALGPAREAVGAGQAAELFEEGRLMSVEQAIALVRRGPS